MIEVIRWVVNYLMAGVIVQFLLQGLAGVLESPKLDIKESIVTILVWPIALLIFGWYFVIGIFK